MTFLFTDIESSTRLLSTLGSVYDDLLDLHHATLRSVWEEHRGHEVNTEGDAFFVAFASADDAVAAAVAAQRALAAAPWPHQPPPRVRMGIHTGYARPRHGDYVALAVNQSARVVGAAHGGQILLTEDTVAELRHAGTAEIVERGRFRVRDFDRPLRLYGVEARGWHDPGRPPRVRPADGHNLVASLSARVDREDELSWLEHSVAPGVIATVTGPGGGGKTRLAVELGFRTVNRWTDGVWFVDLSPVRAADHVAQAIADALGATPVPGAPALDDVRGALEGRTVLLILDNCEHVLEPSARAAHDILTACPGVGILATSRVPLGLAAEKLLRLLPLPYDSDDSPAVELFLNTAPDLGSDVAVVRKLCERLDGIPLALELAAARARTIPPEAILEHLELDLADVESRDPTLPERHRSLQQVLDWSWELLDDRAKTTLVRVAVLAGSFTQQTAMVAGADDVIAARDVPELLWTLVDHSLVRTDLSSGASRYRVSAPVRSYALARASHDDLRRTVLALARHFDVSLGPEHVERRDWASDMAAELDNVRSVVGDLAGVDDELGQALSWAIGRYHDLVNAYAGGASDIERSLHLFRAESPNRVALLALQAYVLLRMGRIDEVTPLVAEAEALAARVGTPPWDEVCVLRVKGDVALRRGDFAEAADLARVGLEEASDPRGRSRMWNLLGVALAGTGDLSAAVDAFDQELATAVAGGLETTRSKTHGNIAEAALRLGMRTRAARHQLECLELARSNGEPVLVAYSVMVAARLLAADPSQLVTAATLHECALHQLEASGHALYGVDAEVREQFRTVVAERLGAEPYAEAAARGRSWELRLAAEQADDVLRTVIDQEE